MEPNSGEIMIKSLAMLALFLGTVWYMFRYAKPKGRQKKFLLGISAVFAPLPVALILGPTLGYGSDMLVLFVVVLATACLITGLTAIIYAGDAVKLWQNTRKRGKAKDWAVPYVPTKPMFYMTGGILMLTGLFWLIMLFITPPQ